MRQPTDEELKWWASMQRLFYRKPETLAVFVDGHHMIAVDAELHRSKAVDHCDRIDDLRAIKSQDIGAGML